MTRVLRLDTMNAPSLKISCKSDIGRLRANNEDAVLIHPTLSIVVLADGMGGHNAGEVASQLAATHIMRSIESWLARCQEKTISRNLKKAIARFINEASELIFKESYLNFERRGMGTTVVVGVVYKNKLTVAHVGDSRVYGLKSGQLERLTKDHTQLQALIDSGVLESPPAPPSPLKNILTRAVGVEPYVDVTFNQCTTSLGDIFLFCSDGLTDMLEDSEIEQLLAQDIEPQDICGQLVDRANAAGGLDNISVAVGVVS